MFEIILNQNSTILFLHPCISIHYYMNMTGSYINSWYLFFQPYGNIFLLKSDVSPKWILIVKLIRMFLIIWLKYKKNFWPDFETTKDTS